MRGDFLGVATFDGVFVGVLGENLHNSSWYEERKTSLNLFAAGDFPAEDRFGVREVMFCTSFKGEKNASALVLRVGVVVVFLGDARRADRILAAFVR